MPCSCSEIEQEVQLRAQVRSQVRLGSEAKKIDPRALELGTENLVFHPRRQSLLSSVGERQRPFATLSGHHPVNMPSTERVGLAWTAAEMPEIGVP